MRAPRAWPLPRACARDLAAPARLGSDFFGDGRRRSCAEGFSVTPRCAARARVTVRVRTCSRGMSARTRERARTGRVRTFQDSRRSGPVLTSVGRPGHFGRFRHRNSARSCPATAESPPIQQAGRTRIQCADSLQRRPLPVAAEQVVFTDTRLASLVGP